MVITSVNNEKIKRICRLKDKKGRKEQSAFLVEGFKMVKEALISSKVSVLTLIGLPAEIEKLPAFSGETVIIDEKVAEKLSSCETTQGVFAVVAIKEIPFSVLNEPCVLLDRVRDPGNLGTIIRTSAAVGIKRLYLFDCADAYSPKVVRSTMSGIYNVELVEVGEQEIEELSKNVLLIGADMSGESVFESKVNGNFCLCMGNESDGLSPFIRSLCKKNLKIPMKNGVESLNVGVAYAIIIYIITNNL